MNYPIKLPTENKEVLMLLIFNYGYLSESDHKFGLGHLTEHYIIRKLEEVLDLKYADATIDESTIEFYLNFKKDTLDPNSDIESEVLNNIKQLDPKADSELIENEKARIKTELQEKYSSPDKIIAQSIESAIIQSPKKFARDRMNQLQNIDDFSPDDVANCIIEILSQYCLSFVGNTIFAEINHDIKSQTQKPTLTTSKTSQQINIDHDIYKDRNCLYANFPINQPSNLLTDISIDFITRELEEKLFSQLKDFGVYKIDSEYFINQQGGYAWFFASSTSSLGDFVALFPKIIEDLINDPELEDELALFKKDRINQMTNDWNDFYGRFDLITENYSEYGEHLDIERITQQINSISADSIKALAREIFID
jgi:predicted Zn-dependent peptidase